MHKKLVQDIKKVKLSLLKVNYIFRHYSTNRAPMILGFDAAWLEINKGFTKELEGWIRDILADHSDVYFVTQIQVRENGTAFYIESY